MMRFFKYNRFERDLLRNIDRYGCHINYVSGGNGSPSISYSVGFGKSVQQPEVIICGMDIDVAHFTINRVHGLCRGGFVLTNGCHIVGILEYLEHSGALSDPHLEGRQVHPSQIVTENLNSAIWYAREIEGTTLSNVIQLFWPSAADGLMPWDSNASPELVALQPRLDEQRAA